MDVPLILKSKEKKILGHLAQMGPLGVRVGTYIPTSAIRRPWLIAYCESPRDAAELRWGNSKGANVRVVFTYPERKNADVSSTVATAHQLIISRERHF